MTRVYLTDRDYEVINSGDTNEIKRHVNNLRGELVELQTRVKAAIQTATPAERVCKLRQAVSASEEPSK
jgi:hypothetical protein